MNKWQRDYVFWSDKPPWQVGLGWYFGNPMAAYSEFDLWRIFGDQWDRPYTERMIRHSVRDGELRGFPRGTVRLFPLEDVVCFVNRYRSEAAGEKANQAILSGYDFLHFSTADFIAMMLAALHGKWEPPREVIEGDKGDGDGPPPGCTPWPRPIGVRRNPKFPPPNASAVLRTPPHFDNSVPGLRTRIKADSLRSKRRHARRKKRSDGGDE